MAGEPGSKVGDTAVKETNQKNYGASVAANVYLVFRGKSTIYESLTDELGLKKAGEKGESGKDLGTEIRVPIRYIPVLTRVSVEYEEGGKIKTGAVYCHANKLSDVLTKDTLRGKKYSGGTITKAYQGKRRVVI